MLSSIQVGGQYFGNVCLSTNVKRKTDSGYTIIKYSFMILYIAIVAMCVVVCVSTLQRPPGKRHPYFILFLPLSDLGYLIGP